MAPRQGFLMARSWVTLALGALCFLFFITGASALTETLKISNDARSAILLRSFGYHAGGYMNVTLWNHKLAVPPAKKDQKTFEIALLIERSDTPADLTAYTSSTCLHTAIIDQSTKVVPVKPDQWDTGVTYTTTVTEPGYYHVYYSNCEESTLASFTISIEEYNVDPVSGSKSYLSTGLDPLPVLYFVLFGCFTLQLGLWVWLLVRRKGDVKLIHLLMASVLGFKVFSLLFDALKYDVLDTSGHNNGWAIAYYVFNSVRALLMFAVLVLAGTGWSSLKPFLTNRDKQFVLVVLLVQLAVNGAWIVVQVTEPGYVSWLAWQSIFNILDLACCLLITLPIYWSIQHLEREAETDGKLATNLTRLRNFRWFYLSCFAYLYVSRLVVYLIETSVSYKLAWLAHFFREISMLFFFFFAGWLFRPQSLNPYLALEFDADVDDDSAVEMGVVGVPDDDFDDEPLTDGDHGYAHPQGALGVSDDGETDA